MNVSKCSGHSIIRRGNGVCINSTIESFGQYKKINSIRFIRYMQIHKKIVTFFRERKCIYCDNNDDDDKWTKRIKDH